MVKFFAYSTTVSSLSLYNVIFFLFFISFCCCADISSRLNNVGIFLIPNLEL